MIYETIFDNRDEAKKRDYLLKPKCLGVILIIIMFFVYSEEEEEEEEEEEDDDDEERNIYQIIDQS